MILLKRKNHCFGLVKGLKRTYFIHLKSTPDTLENNFCSTGVLDKVS